MNLKVFNILDKDHDGILDSNDIKQLFSGAGLKISEEESVKLLFFVSLGSKKDVDEVSFQLFLSGQNCRGDISDEVNEGFKMFASGSSGLVSVGDIQRVLNNMGFELGEDEASELVEKYDRMHRSGLSIEDLTNFLTSQ